MLRHVDPGRDGSAGQGVTTRDMTPIRSEAILFQTEGNGNVSEDLAFTGGGQNVSAPRLDHRCRCVRMRAASAFQKIRRFNEKAKT